MQFGIYTFGCKVNQEESAAMSALFTAAGWQEAPFDTLGLDLYIINTCTVTQMAERKARTLIRHTIRENPQAVIAVVGCYAQTGAKALSEIEGIDLIVGVDRRAELPALVAARMGAAAEPPLLALERNEAFTTISLGSGQRRTRAYLKIEDGCDQFCHYCAIPYARGPVRSLPPKDALYQAQALIEAGHRELVLTGIHIGAYGQDLGGDADLTALLTRILQLNPGRVRLGSIEPHQFTEELFELIGSEPRLCPHLHIPLQSGSDKVLAAMGRHYDTAFYRDLLARLRSLRPGLAISTDVMVGYPGETEEDAADVAAFCAECGFASMHVFPYSRRPGTVADTLPDQVQQAEKARRAAILGRLAEEQRESYALAHLGRELQFLPERIVKLEGREYISGYSAEYIPLLLPCDDGELPQDFVTVVGEKYWQGSLLVAGK
ncbi:MAG: tRNA (N(6)-L-threonylcarbamoyladenosine(37)-C(2))-methylthiotransferase MtaB [Firmicutes bacterium]|nr:tRNA (N(6)-L-threonylcarbamoyladenosine(37)-C(2))-methylthiotransferase MtaB [Bacillota bacterium]MBQ6842602.1 tRNA (N(6)-L-threonylcarbamoyladenosine(37)-C(2))-methylthiotransferase MtaB [Bacillota bacterium]